jgi:hypothetical protein
MDVIAIHQLVSVTNDDNLFYVLIFHFKQIVRVVLNHQTVLIVQPIVPVMLAEPMIVFILTTMISVRLLVDLHANNADNNNIN